MALKSIIETEKRILTALAELTQFLYTRPTYERKTGKNSRNEQSYSNFIFENTVRGYVTGMVFSAIPAAALDFLINRDSQSSLGILTFPAITNGVSGIYEFIKYKREGLKSETDSGNLDEESSRGRL